MERVPNPASSGLRHRGFTLIELMVVLVLIGIMTALIIPEMKGTFEEAVLRSTGRKIIDVLHLASSQAITINRAQRVRFDQKTSRYLIQSATGDRPGITGNDVPGGTGEIDSRITFEIRKPEGESSGDEQEKGTFISGDELGKSRRDEAITFLPDGTADAAEILLRDREGFRLLLRINPITARVRITEMERK